MTKNKILKIRKMDIWTAFGREAEKVSRKKDDVSVYFVGGQNSGKSSLISRYAESGSEKTTRATIGLEYSYVRRGNYLAHIWEGGGRLDGALNKLIQGNRSPLSRKSFWW